jgi:hypothetical protein
MPAVGNSVPAATRLEKSIQFVPGVFCAAGATLRGRALNVDPLENKPTFKGKARIKPSLAFLKRRHKPGHAILRVWRTFSLDRVSLQGQLG